MLVLAEDKININKKKKGTKKSKVLVDREYKKISSLMIDVSTHANHSNY